MAAVTKAEPAITIGAVASLVVVTASVFNIAIDPGTVQTILLALVPIVSGFVTRRKVTPVG